MSSKAFIVHLLAALILATGLTITPARADDVVLRSPYGGEVRALVIGIDAYQHVRQLKGAVADARDIEGALRRTGVRDVNVLVNGNADRSSVLRSIYALLQRAGPRDLVIISLAGHGSQEPERVRGSHPDGLEDVFLLPGFEDSPAGSKQRILGAEFNHFIRQFESRGAHVLFVADTCFGGGLTRDIDPRDDQMSFRQVPSYRLSADLLQPVTNVGDEFLTDLDFSRTAFLAAVDRKTKAPEVEIPGIPGLRGALSYAVARSIEGDADSRGDGKTTINELFGAVRQVVYQLSNERQNVVTTASPEQNANTEVILQLQRSVNVSSPDVAEAIRPLQSEEERPVRISALDGDASHFIGLKPLQAPFKIVRPVDHPDLTLDPTSHDVLSWGDVVAYHINDADLPSIIDRAMAIRELKLMASKTPQSIKVTPDDSLHHNSSLVQVEVDDVGGRALILFNVAGDGTVQRLYPIGSDPAVLRIEEYSFPVRVREPFGSDQVVAITSQQRMPELEKALQELDKRRAAVQMIGMIKRLAPSDARIGSAGLFTAP